MAMQQPSQPYSVTCVTHDEAVLHCLNALAYFTELVGTEPGPGTTVELSGLTWPHQWEREDGRIQFHFSDPRRRSMFLGEATRLLAGKWTRIAVEDEVARA